MRDQQKLRLLAEWFEFHYYPKEYKLEVKEDLRRIADRLDRIEDKTKNEDNQRRPPAQSV